MHECPGRVGRVAHFGRVRSDTRLPAQRECERISIFEPPNPTSTHAPRGSINGDRSPLHNTYFYFVHTYLRKCLYLGYLIPADSHQVFSLPRCGSNWEWSGRADLPRGDARTLGTSPNFASTMHAMHILLEYASIPGCDIHGAPGFWFANAPPEHRPLEGSLIGSQIQCASVWYIIRLDHFRFMCDMLGWARIVERFGVWTSPRRTLPPTPQPPHATRDS